MAYSEITADELRDRLASGEELVVLDVRSPGEYSTGHLPGCLHIPLDDIVMRHQELDPDQETVVVCSHGIRSASVAFWLTTQAGFTHCANLRGGLTEWNGPLVAPDS